MANNDPKGKTKYWIDGSSSTLIRSKLSVNTNTQVYWYNGQPQSYILGDVQPSKLKIFTILIGF